MSRQFKVPLNLARLATDPVSASIGDIYFNTTGSKIRLYTSTGWTDITGGGGGTLNHTHDYNGNPIVGDGSTLVAVATFGSGVPSNSSGLNGDLYIDTTNLNIYTKAANVWTLQTSFNAYTKGQVDNLVSVLNGLTATTTELNYVHGVTSPIQTQIDSKLSSSTASSTYLTQTNASSTYAPINNPTFTGTVNGVTASMVGLGNVNNTSDVNKPISTATQSALNLKAPIASPTFTGTVSGITAAMVGLGNVNNTSDLNKPISTATQSALDGKAATNHNHTVSNITDITASAAELNILDGVTVSSTEINYLSGLSDNVQAQLNNIGNTIGDYVPLAKVGQADGVAATDPSNRILAPAGVKFSDNTVQTTAFNTSGFATSSQLSAVEVLALAGL